MSTFQQSEMNASRSSSSSLVAVLGATTLVATLPLQIADQLCQSIVEERLAPGTHLKETELSAAFGVSRATVREALRITESRGLVRISPQKGAEVTMLTPTELENLFEIRAGLLGLAARRLARSRTPEVKSALKSGLSALADSTGDSVAYVRASSEMVQRIADLAGNEQLADFISSFALKIGRYSRLGLATEKRRAQSLASWKRLVQAIGAGDESLSEQIFRDQALANRDASLSAMQQRLKSQTSRPAHAGIPANAPHLARES